MTDFVHVAATWNRGTVTFYFEGLRKNSRTIGTAGLSLIVDNDGTLFLGSADGSGNLLDGVIDEVRISQDVIYTSDYTVPTVPFDVIGE